MDADKRGCRKIKRRGAEVLGAATGRAKFSVTVVFFIGCELFMGGCRCLKRLMYSIAPYRGAPGVFDKVRFSEYSNRENDEIRMSKPE